MSENGTPRINYGFGGSIKWKGITLDVHFQGVGKYDRFVGGVDGGFYQHGGTIRPYFPIWTSDKVYDPELNPDESKYWLRFAYGYSSSVRNHACSGICECY